MEKNINLVQLQNMLSLFEIAGIKEIPLLIADVKELLNVAGEAARLEMELEETQKRLTLSNEELGRVSSDFARLSMQFIAVKESETSLEKENILLKSEVNTVNTKLITTDGGWVELSVTPIEDEDVSGVSTDVEFLTQGGNIRRGYFVFANGTISLYGDSDDMFGEDDLDFNRFQAWRYLKS